MVMCSEPVTRTPERGFSTAYLRRMAIRPGISNSAMEISLRPQSASERSATLKSVTVWFSVAVPILNFLVSINLDRLILDNFYYGVNPKIAEAGGGPEPAADPIDSGTGRAVRGGDSGDSGEGAEPDLDPPGAVETGGAGGRPAYGQERLLPLQGVGGADGIAATGGQRGPRSGAGPRGVAAGAAQAPGHDAALLRRTGGQVRAAEWSRSEEHTSELQSPMYL